MPRVLILCEYPSLNGGERSLLAMVDHMHQEDLTLRFAAPGNGPLAEAIGSRGFPLLPLDLHDRLGRRHAIGECRLDLRKLLFEHRPDLIHANSLSMSRLVGPVAAALGIPSIGHLRDMIKLNATAMRDLGTNTRLLAVSQATAGWYRNLGLDDVKIHVLHNGVDLDVFCPRPATGALHRELAIPGDAALIGAIGQVGMRKGLDVFVRAAAIIAAARRDVHFVVIGQRYSQKFEAVEYERIVRQQAETGPLARRFHWLGSRSDVHQLLNEFSLLVHASRQEPLGRVLLESAAAGLPCIATAVGGTAEIFPEEVHAAVLIPPDNAVRMAEEALRLLSDRGLRERLSGNARRRAEQAFRVQIAARGLVEHYQALLSTGR